MLQKSGISKVGVLSDCGHAFCGACTDNFLNNEKNQTAARISCLVCSKGNSHLLRIQNEGSGYSSAGGAVFAEKFDFPFQC